MLNLNNAQEQSQGGRTIPPLSKVMVRLSIQAPQAERLGSMPELARSQNSSLEYLSTILEVVSGSFQGVKIYHNFNVAGASTENHKKAIDISMRSIRAIVEAHNHISPKDTTERASKARMLESYSQLHGMAFPIMVKCEESRPNKDGQIFMNNALRNIVTMEDADFVMLMSGGEIISNEAIPQVPGNRVSGNQASGNQVFGNQTSGNEQAQTNSTPNSSYAQTTQQSNSPTLNQAPPWAKPTQNKFPKVYAPPPQTHYGSPFPSEAANMDDTPF